MNLILPNYKKETYNKPQKIDKKVEEIEFLNQFQFQNFYTSILQPTLKLWPIT